MHPPEMSEIPDFPPAPPAPSTRRRVSGVVIAVIGLLGFYGYLFSGIVTGDANPDKLSWRWYPVELTMRYADREMAYEAMSDSLAPPLRALIQGIDWPATEPADDARQALEACAEYLDAGGTLDENPTIPLALAVLAAERDDTATMDQWLVHLESSSSTQADAQRVRDAYADPPRRVGEEWSEETASKLIGNWFYSTLMARFAESRGEAELAAGWREVATQDIDARIHTFTAFGILGGVLLLGGVAGVCYWWNRPPPPASEGPGWSPITAVNVVAWGGLLGVLLEWTIWILTDTVNAHQWLTLLTMPWFFLPVMAVFYFAVARPKGLSMLDAFGLRPRMALLWAGLAIFLIDGLAQCAWFALLKWTGALPSPVEGLGEELIWGEMPDRVLDTLDAALGAGTLEELVYRGVLFLGLRQRFGFAASAILSSLMFTLPHLQYGWASLISVAIFGVLMAWSVERTRSLLPAIFAHATYNLLVSVWQWSIYT